MIYSIAQEVATALKAKGVPYPVIYGPERGPRSMTETRIVIERDRRANETLEAPHKRVPNPKMIFVRWLPITARVFAYSPVNGPMTHDHEREADLLVDPLTVAIHTVVRERGNQYRITSAHLLNEDELKLAGLEQWPGVVYELKLQIDRGVNDVTWQGAAKATAKVTAINTTRNVSGSAVTAGDELPSASVRQSQG